ncbi:uncharacterized protein LOC114280111 isoform X1 [Camellia sinensis]|nr:uncharacterized protein LOC114280111 isoform X1 [Camellia sinensis]
MPFFNNANLQALHKSFVVSSKQLALWDPPPPQSPSPSTSPPPSPHRFGSNSNDHHRHHHHHHHHHHDGVAAEKPHRKTRRSLSLSSMDEVITAADASSSLRSYSSEPSVGPWNLPLLSAFLACALAQFLKPFTTWIKEKRWDSRRMVASGGMPSSHSATVTALAMAVGLQEGTGGAAFAIAVVLACVVMYDATGVRLHAGRQAELLNQIVCELPPEHPVSSVKPLRDSLGHTPLQVTAGAILGCIVAYVMKSSS